MFEIGSKACDNFKARLIDTQLAAHITCVEFTHLLARTPCDPMWLSHGGMLHPDWPANPLQLTICSVTAS